jgi:nitrogen-specific signal transduction histidine kinase
VDIPLPYSVRSARHHFRNLLGVIRGFSEILMEGLDPEESDLPHYEFMIESSDRIQKFVDRVLCSDEILKRQEWKEPFWINVEHDMKSIQKTVEGLLILNSGEEKGQIKTDLAKIQMAADEVLTYSKDFISHCSSQDPSKKGR